ncbi:MAG: hypothetical protein AAF558_09195 [Verrucomicrobiota bacterium]
MSQWGSADSSGGNDALYVANDFTSNLAHQSSYDRVNLNNAAAEWPTLTTMLCVNLTDMVRGTAFVDPALSYTAAIAGTYTFAITLAVTGFSLMRLLLLLTDSLLRFPN